MKLLISTFFTLLLIGFAGSSYAQFGLFGPSDYDECIIEGMQGITSDVAAQAVQMACYSKFSKSRSSKPRVDYEGTCLFLYSLDSGMERLTQREWDRLDSYGYDSTLVMRNGVSQQQLNAVMDALRTADAAGNSDVARSMVITNFKRIRFKKGLTEDYVLTQNIPYCSKASL
jgi:hypothetical protein